jgi:hypothetical protein
MSNATKKAYEISVGQPLPSLNRDYHRIEAETFQDAIDEVKKLSLQTGMGIVLHPVYKSHVTGELYACQTTSLYNIPRTSAVGA